MDETTSLNSQKINHNIYKNAYFSAYLEYLTLLTETWNKVSEISMMDLLNDFDPFT